ncbi:nicotinate-nucleotide adenylyltransferase [Bacillus aerolatus]|uniref:Probable nicotinate-nucleotide adenylyltransferase n=1 Tax=Bacillus aerolatus TaxID=2653354 RepID=A0A6I1FJ44_9BACI|nr:nicotinate-nucleotide adenylyltransferase [Bacillus aerolatus]KAB7708705.1 nicotinate-nucleotide adenylyltransferase [Bacillus aerolatus]
MSKKTGILGGTFNPPHLGHLMMANEVLEALGLDEIRFMPNHIPPHKVMNEDIRDDDRIHMLSAAIEGHPCFSLELTEVERKGTSYTFDTMKLLKEQEPETEFYFIIGGDMIEYLPKWHRIDELSRMIQFVGVRRPGYSTKTPYPVTLIETPEVHLSSTMLRQRAANGGTLRYLLPEKVITYIKENRLYES